jgi:hypothetical protein
MDIFWRTRDIGAELGNYFGRGEIKGVPWYPACSESKYRETSLRSRTAQNIVVQRWILQLGLRDRDAGGGQRFFVDGDEEAFGTSEDGAIGVLDFGVVEQFAAWGAVDFRWAAKVPADENERLVEGNGAEVIDLHVAGHGEDVQRAIELAHGFVEERGNDAAVDVARGTLVHAVELEVRCGGYGLAVRGIGCEDEVQALRIGGTAAKAEVGALVDGGVGFEESWCVASGVRRCLGHEL